MILIKFSAKDSTLSSFISYVCTVIDLQEIFQMFTQFILLQVTNIKGHIHYLFRFSMENAKAVKSQLIRKSLCPKQLQLILIYK